MTTKQENIQNAYLLVYDRVEQHGEADEGMGQGQGEVEGEGKSEAGAEGEGVAAKSGADESGGDSAAPSPISLVPPHIFRDVVDANNRFALDRW